MTEPRRELVELLRDFDAAMLVTRTPSEDLRSRPMAIARVEDDGALVFVTGASTDKVDELERHPEVNVSLQADQRFVSISGRARITRDRELVDEVWSPAFKPWFPDGKEDPDLRVLRVEPRRGEYWDMTGGERFAFLVKAGKALLTGSKMNEDIDDEGHAKVDLS